MHQDILTLTRTKIIEQEVTEHYCILTCRNCGSQQEFLGHINIHNLHGGWAALSLDTNETGSVFEWLLCPGCVDKVKKSLG